MRVLWTGNISFGLVNIPIRLFAATRDHDIHFHQLHRSDHGRVRYRVVCAACGDELAPDGIIKGYEYATERHVTFEEDELEAMALEVSRTIDILDFVGLAEVDPLYFQKGYYLAPQTGAAKAYQLLCEALTRTQRVAVASLVLRRKGQLALIRPAGERLLLETMYYADEVNPVGEVPIETAAVTDRELELAISLIGQLSVPFDPTRYRDAFRDRLEAAIGAKIEGRQGVAPPARERAEIRDLMTALEQSLKKTSRPAEFTAAMPGDREGSGGDRTAQEDGDGRADAPPPRRRQTGGSKE